MGTTLRQLVNQRDLQLRVLTGQDHLDQPLGFVAISELPDPTPWLQGAVLLLTSGMWLSDAAVRDGLAEEWVDRVVAAGARGVGFGLAPFFDEVPAELVAAARRHDLVLVEVPSRTPFVGIDRRVADLQAAEARRQEAEVARGQLRLVTAARGGTGAVIDLLAREIGGWVVGLDAAHDVTDAAGALDGVDAADLRALAEGASRDARHSVLAEAHGVSVYAVPLGEAENRVGTLCVDGRALTSNPSRRAGLVGAAAVLLAVLPGQQDRTVGRVLVDLLLAGDGDGATRLAHAADIDVPDRLVAVALTGVRRQEAASQAVALGAWPVPQGTRALEVVAGDPAMLERRLAEILVRTATRGGLSAPHPPRELARAVQEARSNAALAGPDRPLVDQTHGTAARLAGVLDAEDTRRLAGDLLSPLGDAPERDLLLTSAAAWLRAHGRWDPAAAALGVHRETLRGRMHRLAEVLDLDLDSFHDRLALALALESRGPVA